MVSNTLIYMAAIFGYASQVLLVLLVIFIAYLIIKWIRKKAKSNNIHV